MAVLRGGGGGWKGAEAGWGRRQMADSRDCIMHPRVGETPTSPTPPSPTLDAMVTSRNIRGSWNLWWKGDRDTHTMCFHSLIMNNCDVQRANFRKLRQLLGYESEDTSSGRLPTKDEGLKSPALERIFHPMDFSRIFISDCVPGRRLSTVWRQNFVRWMVCNSFILLLVR